MEETQYLQPDLYFNGVRVTEFSIALTSVLVTAVCWYAWARLGRQVRTDEVRLFRIFLLLMGFSTLIGGLAGHAFLSYLPFIFKTPGWGLGMLAVSALEQASIQRAKPYIGERWARILFIINIVELTVMLCLVCVTLWFPLVEIHSAFGMVLIVGTLEGWMYYQARQPAHPSPTGEEGRSSLYMLLSILFAAAAAGAHVAKLSLNTWFTFFDVGHVFMCGTIWMILKAALIGNMSHPDFFENQ